MTTYCLLPQRASKGAFLAAAFIWRELRLPALCERTTYAQAASDGAAAKSARCERTPLLFAFSRIQHLRHSLAFAASAVLSSGCAAYRRWRVSKRTFSRRGRHAGASASLLVPAPSSVCRFGRRFVLHSPISPSAAPLRRAALYAQSPSMLPANPVLACGLPAMPACLSLRASAHRAHLHLHSICSCKSLKTNACCAVGLCLFGVPRRAIQPQAPHGKAIFFCYSLPPAEQAASPCRHGRQDGTATYP